MSACAGGLEFVRGVDGRRNISRTTMEVVTLCTRRRINCFHGLVESEPRLAKSIHVASEHKGSVEAFAGVGSKSIALGIKY